MARTTGTYAAPASTWNPAVEGTAVDETDWNTLLEDMEAALTESVYTAGLGSTDNRLVRTDGTDTKKAQGSAVGCDDSGNLTGVGGVTMAGSLVNTEGALSLVNGANTDIVLPVGRFITITGPSGAFSVNGFASPVDGREIVLYNSVAQDMTISNDATSAAANRILTLTGSDVALTGVCVAKFTYSAVSSRWILTGTQG
jgi:hypothetical protein